MTHHYYPVALDLRGKRCLVVGGGHIAGDKVEGLIFAGADVTVVSPVIDDRIARLASEGRITVHRRTYSPEDMQGVYLVYGATDDREVNAQVAEHGREAGALANAVDDIPFCDFFAMAIVRRGDLQISISTNGRSPAFARWMREKLDAAIPSHYAGLLQILGEARAALKARGPIPGYEHWQDALSGDLIDDVENGRLDSARNRLLTRLEAIA